MAIYKYHIVIQVESKMLFCQVIHRVSLALLFEQKKVSILDENDQLDLGETLSQLLKAVTYHLPCAQPSDFLVEIYLPAEQTQQAMLSLPSPGLTCDETTQFVSASIYKLFHLPSSDVAFDYLAHQVDLQKLSVVICDKSVINLWCTQLAKQQLSVRFIGLMIKDKLFSDAKGHFNFLPWRITKQKQQKQQLLAFLIFYICTMLSVVGYLWWQISDEFEQYQRLILEKKEVQRQKVSQLAELRFTVSPHQQQITDFLLIISAQKYPNILFDSLTYTPQKLLLTGQSLSYLDITYLVALFRKKRQIQTAHVVSVSMKNAKLIFQMEITLNG